jgi:hypothetical protein
MKATVIKSSGSIILEKTDNKTEWCVTSVEKGATVYCYFSNETKAFEHYAGKVKKQRL